MGKTTMAAVAALDAAERGHKTLLVSTDPAHSTGDVLAAKLGDQPQLVEDNCWAMEIDPEHEADRYIDGVKERVASAAPPVCSVKSIDRSTLHVLPRVPLKRRSLIVSLES